MARTFHALYDERALQTPAAPAVKSWRGGSVLPPLTYAELRDRSLQIAVGLRGAGLRSPAPADGSPRCSAAAAQAGASAVVAVHLPRTHEDFLPTLLALSRCGATFALMSTDLQEKQLELDRNSLIAKELEPCAVVATLATTEAARTAVEGMPAEVVAVEDLVWDDAKLTSTPPVACTGAGAEDAPLCFLFTGGTTRSRCVAVTHAMVCHERARYSDCMRLLPTVRVLANTSVYWGASALGQLSIALAYGGCAILCESTAADDLRTVISAESPGVVLGLVPDQLRMLADSPAAELPGVFGVFTWGERLPLALAERWRDHPCAQLRELLISTEYWLALYAAPLEGGQKLLQTVRDVRTLVLVEGEREALDGEIGELLLAGPMVTSGYVTLSADATGQTPASSTGSPFRTVNGTQYFCTRDLVRVTHGGHFEFCGRTDMTIKVKGKWVDLLSIEDALGSLSGVAAAAVLPDRRGGDPHAFVALNATAEPDFARTVGAARALLPRGAQLRVLEQLPRHPVTRKVDVKSLAAKVARVDAGSWPVYPEALPPDHISQRARRKVWDHCCWTLIAAVAAGAWDLRTLARLLPVSGQWVSRRSPIPRASGAGFLLLPFMHLACLHALEHQRWDALAGLVHELPLGMWGAMLLVLAGRGSSAHAGRLRFGFEVAAALWAGAGAVWAINRRRLFSYPTAFWFGIGHRLQYDNERWLRWSTWSGHFRWQLERLVACMQRLSETAEQSTRESSSGAGRRGAGGGESLRNGSSPSSDAASRGAATSDQGPASTSSPTDGPPLCKYCRRAVVTEWPPPESRPAEAARPAGGCKDGAGAPVCWSCWCTRSADALQEAGDLARRLFADKEAADAAGADHAGTVEAVNGPVAVAAPVDGHSVGAADAAPSVETHNGPATDASDGDDFAASAAIVQQAGVADGIPAAAVAGDEHQDEPVNGSAEHAESSGDHEALAAAGDGQEKEKEQLWTPRQFDRWKQKYDRWWWYQKTQDVFDVTPSQAEALCIQKPGRPRGAPPEEEPSCPRMRRLCHCLAQVDGALAAAGHHAPLHSLDSLHVSLLTSRVRAEFGAWGLSVGAVRRAGNAAELLEEVDAAEKAARQGCEARPSEEARAVTSSPDRGEYKLWFSPGQHVPMGGWVLRTDVDIDADRLEEAARRLIDRHVALRTTLGDPLRMLSFFLDTAILFSLVSRLLERGPWPARLLRCCASWALRTAWPRVVTEPRESAYADRQAKAPFEVVRRYDQPSAERAFRERRSRLHDSCRTLDIALVRLEAQLVGVWVVGWHGGDGDFILLPAERAGLGGPSQLAYVDLARRETGLLVGPGDPNWCPPPYGFPALLCAHLLPGHGVIWVRLNKANELAMLWKPDNAPETKWARQVAFRMPGRENITNVFTFLVVHAMHSLADGLSFEPIVGDLLHIYGSLAPGDAPPPLAPPICNSLKELEGRLLSCLNAANFAARPQQVSLRGNLWRFRQKGYGHNIGLQRGAISALKSVAAAYGAPFDALILSLSVAALARASNLDVVELTLYVPVRDAPGEAGLVGLYADWRNVTILTDPAACTVLGVALEVAHVLRTRRWAVFNAIRKPECMMVNFQPLDAAPPQSRGGFKQIGEEMWRIGENMKQESRSDELGWAPQPLSLTIEEGDKDSWWLLVGAAVNIHPPAWMRKFVHSFEEAMWALLTNPTQLVHKEFPEDFY